MPVVVRHDRVEIVADATAVARWMASSVLSTCGARVPAASRIRSVDPDEVDSSQALPDRRQSIRAEVRTAREIRPEQGRRHPARIAFRQEGPDRGGLLLFDDELHERGTIDVERAQSARPSDTSRDGGVASDGSRTGLRSRRSASARRRRPSRSRRAKPRRHRGQEDGNRPPPVGHLNGFACSDPSKDGARIAARAPGLRCAPCATW